MLKIKRQFGKDYKEYKDYIEFQKLYFKVVFPNGIQSKRL